jgi:hypothetical protein
MSNLLQVNPHELTGADIEFLQSMYTEDRLEQETSAMEQLHLAQQMWFKLPGCQRPYQVCAMFRRNGRCESTSRDEYRKTAGGYVVELTHHSPPSESRWQRGSDDTSRSEALQWPSPLLPLRVYLSP